MGLASLADANGGSTAAGATVFEVQAHRLDEAFADSRIGLLKVDVEGHEPAVLAGAEELLRAGAIRDVVFEDHHPYPDECTRMLEGAGYHLVALDNDLFGLRLLEPRERVKFNPWPGPSYLATRDPERALSRLRPRGWQVPEIGPSLPRIRFGRRAR
jgi:hypothetical protein